MMWGTKKALRTLVNEDTGTLAEYDPLARGDLCRFQLATNNIEKGSLVHVDLRVHLEELSKRCYNKRWPGQVSHEELCGCCVEVGVICEEPNVSEIDEYAEELQNVFGRISGVRRGRSRSTS